MKMRKPKDQWETDPEKLKNNRVGGLMIFLILLAVLAGVLLFKGT